MDERLQKAYENLYPENKKLINALILTLYGNQERIDELARMIQKES